MRGKVQTAFTFLIDTGITPAYAGKRCRNQSGDCRYKDHPRLCGEKYATINIDKMHKGSPPPMRGKGIQSYNDAVNPGITPAYAGKS